MYLGPWLLWSGPREEAAFLFSLLSARTDLAKRFLLPDKVECCNPLTPSLFWPFIPILSTLEMLWLILGGQISQPHLRESPPEKFFLSVWNGEREISDSNCPFYAIWTIEIVQKMIAFLKVFLIKKIFTTSLLPPKYHFKWFFHLPGRKSRIGVESPEF